MSRRKNVTLGRLAFTRASLSAPRFALWDGADDAIDELALLEEQDGRRRADLKAAVVGTFSCPFDCSILRERGIGDRNGIGQHGSSPGGRFWTRRQ
jgi:hypothetical protein